MEKAGTQVEIVNVASFLRQRKTLDSFCNKTCLLLLKKKEIIILFLEDQAEV